MAEDIWTIQAALDWTIGYLDRKGDENPRVSAQWLLSEATGLSRIELYANFDRPLSLAERDMFREFVSRRGKGEPLQYITGEVGFRHIALKVRPGVLIPRPETEVLVSEALALLPAPERPCATDSLQFDLSQNLEEGVQENKNTELLVADICTGSGCIACSLAFEHPDIRVIASDIAPEAVQLARENATSLGLAHRVEVVECDLGEGIPFALMGSFDLITSNPPYIPTAVLEEIPREVSDFEPSLALDGGVDGLDVYRRLLTWCAKALKPMGALVFELHETCMKEAAQLAYQAGFIDVHIAHDLADKPRILTALKGSL